MAALPLGVATGIVAGRLTRAAAPGTIGEPIPDARVTLTPEFGIAAAPHASASRGRRTNGQATTLAAAMQCRIPNQM